MVEEVGERSLERREQVFGHGPLHIVESVSKDSNCLYFPSSVESFEVDVAPPMQHGALEMPNFGQYHMLLGSLLLTTILAAGSAYDAKSACVDQELYWIENFLDDDQIAASNYQSENSAEAVRAECLKMFEYVIVPVTATTWLLGILAFYLLHRHLQYLDTLAEHYTPSHTGTLVRLFMLLIIILVAWTFAIFSIMLKPKVNPNLYDQNPFKSLAAVDQMGHIGDNANLFYLSWVCQALIMILVYLVMMEIIRRTRRTERQKPAQIEEVKSFSEQISIHEQIQTMLSYTSAKRVAALYKQRQKKWYQFIYRLRERSGMWVAAFFSSVTLLASSTYVFVQVLVALAISISGDSSFRYRDVCIIVQGSKEIAEEFCVRSSFAVLTGAVASCLCLVALIMHILVRRRSAYDEDRQHSCTIMATQVIPSHMDVETYRLQLALEFILSMCLSILLGLNAIFATGVQGPASTVGNLYYASWASFLLCLRICLGCLEELYHVEYPRADNGMSKRALVSPSHADSSQASVSGSEISLDMSNYKKMSKKERQSRLRKYFFLSIFSAVCFASARDAAYNQNAVYSKDQKYLILAPIASAAVSVVMFFLCLKPKLYEVASTIYFGGLLSIVCFVVWVIDLVLLMHSQDSWAVNRIGEMQLANLYYFSWAAILTAAMQMISYIKPLFGKESKDATFLVWAGIVKVCAVILGAASHVWHNISDTCSNANLEGAEQSFCLRTRGAQLVAIVGWLAGWIVMLLRILNCTISRKARLRTEAAVSIFLVLIFGVAVALITSIGGPGQSVGDLYYSTWLAFWVSIGILVSSFDQMKETDITEEAKFENEGEEYMQYTDMSGSNLIAGGVAV